MAKGALGGGFGQGALVKAPSGRPGQGAFSPTRLQGAFWQKAPWGAGSTRVPYSRRPQGALAEAPWPNPPPGAFVQNHARAPWDWET